MHRKIDIDGLAKRLTPCVLLASHLLAVSAVSADASSVRDQGQIFSTDGVVDLGTDHFSQSITAGITGNLAAIEVQCDGKAEAGCVGDVRYSVFSGGNPVSGSALYTELVSEMLEPSEVYRWSLPASRDLFFKEGEQFTLAFQAQQTGSIFAGNDPPGYDGGSLFKNGKLAGPSRENGELTGEARDVAFISYVSPSAAPIPVPPSMALLGGACLCLSVVAAKRRRRRQ